MKDYSQKERLQKPLRLNHKQVMPNAKQVYKIEQDSMHSTVTIQPNTQKLNL